MQCMCVFLEVFHQRVVTGFGNCPSLVLNWLNMHFQIWTNSDNDKAPGGDRPENILNVKANADMVQDEARSS